MFDFGLSKKVGKDLEKTQNDSPDNSNRAELEALVLSVQKGDLKAFGRIYDLLVEKVYKYIFFKVDQETAFDLTETVFLKVWENIGKYQSKEGSSFSSWVFRIAHNMIVDHHRFGRESLPLDIDIADHKQDNNPVHVVEQSLSKQSLRTALSKLKDNYQEVLTLSFLNGLDNDEVARAMGKSEGSLRVLKFRALQELKRVLLDMGIKY